MQVNMHEAKTRLSQLVEKAEQGEEVLIARGGKPVARLVALEIPPVLERPLGLLKPVALEPNFRERSLEALGAEELTEWHGP
ncbi:MAG: type II toxin-antitoxin system prevent-host-death family antitoxin [Pseudopedobacter sp.]|nr:type II toxin-antitoxin system prevent-host-death family antitoxin [Deinococcales bacterium]